MSPVLVPPRPGPPREPPAPDPLDAADAALARVRAALRDASEDDLDTNRHEIHVTVNTAQPPPARVPQPSAHDLSEYVAPAVTMPKVLGALVTLAGALGAIAKALGWF
jgi:hypothetical protein